MQILTDFEIHLNLEILSACSIVDYGNQTIAFMVFLCQFLGVSLHIDR